MAKDIDLASLRKQQAKEKQETLLARATGKKLIQPPPPAKPMAAGTTGRPPLPEGKVVGAIAPSSLTANERQALENVGWTEDIPIPENMAELFEGLKAQKASEADQVTLPIDPRTPPLKIPEPVPLAKLSRKEAEDAGIFDAMKSAVQTFQERKEAENEEKLNAMRFMKVAGLREGQAAVKQAQAYREQKAAEQLQDPEIVDDRPAPSARPRPAIQPKRPGPTAPLPPAREAPIIREEEPEPETAPEPQAAPAAAPSDTGADLHLSHCPHCDWPLHMPGIEEPPYADKMSFLHTLLGRQCWVKEVPLLGGNITVTFRTITVRELDVIYAQAYRDRQKNPDLEEVDFWEKVNRYRLFLQIVQFRSDGPNGFLQDMPDGLSKASNEEASAWWWKDEDDALLTDGETPLPDVERWIIGNILKTEAIFRIVNNACNNFNRMVAKLEAMADNSDFWKPTEGQS